MLKVRQRSTILYDITYMWNLKKYNILMNKQKGSKLRYREQSHGYQCRGRVLGGGGGEEGTIYWV